MDILTRNALLAPTADSTDTSRMISVTFNVVGLLPLISMAQHMITSGEDETDPKKIEYDRSISSDFIGEPEAADFYNHPIDPDMAGRYTPIAFISSNKASNLFYLYHDEKYGDLLLFPSLRSIGDTDVSRSYLRSTTQQITAYRVGSTSRDGNLTGFVRPPNAQIARMPKPTSIAPSKVHYIPTFLTGQQPLYEVSGIKFPNGYLESSRMPVNALTSIGSSSDVFGGNVYIHRLIDTGFNHSRLVPAGSQDVADILIPMP